MNKMPEIYLFTVTISKMEPMYLELSPKVAASIPKVTEMVLDLVQKLEIIRIPLFFLQRFISN